MDPGRFPVFANQVRDELSSREGVRWVEVVPLLGRAVIDLERPDDIELIVGVLDHLDEIETAHGAVGEAFPTAGPEHPGDVEPIVRTLTTITGDVVGLSLSLAGRAWSLAPLPGGVDLASAISLLEGTPRLRQLVESQLGPRAADLVLALSNAIAQGLAQSPFGPALDVANRSLALAEQTSRRRVWEKREPELCAVPSEAEPTLPDGRPRPAPLPRGPIETYAERAWIGSLGGFGLGLAITRSFERASGALYAGLPKAARLGREAFSAQLGRALAARGVLVLDAEALRRLDRIDTVVVTADLLLSGELAAGEVAAVGQTDPGEAQRRVAVLFDPANPRRTKRREGWALQPADRLRVELDDHASRLRERLGPHGTLVLALTKKGQLRALLATRLGLAEEAADLCRAVRTAEYELVVAGGTDRTAAEVGADRRIPGGGELPEAIRALQLEDRGIAVVATGAEPALALADVGIGITRPEQPPPWGASLVCRDRLDDARFCVEAAAVARQVSRQCATIALGGASVGGFMAFGGLLPGTTRRVMTAVNAATAVSIINGTRAAVALARKPAPPRRDAIPWHALEVDEVLARLDADRRGLPTTEAERRLERPPPTPPWPIELSRYVAEELFNPLTPVLAAGAGLSVAVGSVVDAAMVTGVVGLNALVGGVQQYRTDRAVAALGRGEDRYVRARRDGEERPVRSSELVPGDVLRLGAGEAVPADCRILEAMACEADESSLTGESLPVAKHPAPIAAPAVADRTSMLYEGTSIAVGEAIAVVVATGAATQTRRAALEAGAEAPETGVEARLRSLTQTAVPVSTLSGLGVVGAGLLRGFPLADLAGAGVSLAVSAAPEGLPILATVAQLGAARRLSRRGALVRNPRAVEALGRVDVVCFDKTGTLTVGRIALAAVSDGSAEEDANGLSAPFRAIVAAGLRSSPEPTCEPLPHPTDQSLVDGARDAGVEADEEAPGWERMDELPFEPGRGYHAVLGRTPDGLRITVKGAPEVVLPRCASRRDATGEAILLDDEGHRELEATVDRMARRGLRILAIAERRARSHRDLDDDRVSDLVFLGFLGFADPVRPAAADAIRGLREAGVDAVMITGDHPSTAEGIAAELGLLTENGIVTGPQLDELDDDALEEAIGRTFVFARVTPSHKVRIVRALRRKGRVVSMTGDGANDAPAIRLADVGIALGERCTPAARAAADLIVTDDRIETIVEAVVEGRALWASVRESVSVLLGGNLGDVGFTLLGSLFTGTPPINARQLLLVNLVTDVAPAMAIALRPSRKRAPEELRREGPDRSLGTSLNRQIAIRAATTTAGATGAWLVGRATGTPARARTIGLVGLVGTQLGQTLVAGGRDPWVLAAGLGSTAALAGVIQTPGLSQFFGCTPLGPVGWATGLTASGLATGASVALPAVVDHAGRLGQRITGRL